MIDRLAQELNVFTKKYLCSYSNLSTKGTKVEVWFVSPTTFAVHWAAENWKNNMFNNYCSRVGSTLCQVWSCGFVFKICKCWGWPALSLLQCLMIFKFISTLGSSVITSVGWQKSTADHTSHQWALILPAQKHNIIFKRKSLSNKSLLKCSLDTGSRVDRAIDSSLGGHKV